MSQNAVNVIAERFPMFLDLTDSVACRAREQSLPSALYAVVGASDAMSTRANETWDSLAAGPRRVIDQVEGTYERLVGRGQERVLHLGADRAVRAKFSQVEDSLAPKAANLAVRYAERAQRAQASPARKRTVARARRAKETARRSADRFAEMNAPVLLDD